MYRIPVQHPPTLEQWSIQGESGEQVVGSRDIPKKQGSLKAKLSQRKMEGKGQKYSDVTYPLLYKYKSNISK